MIVTNNHMYYERIYIMKEGVVKAYLAIIIHTKREILRCAQHDNLVVMLSAAKNLSREAVRRTHLQSS